MTEPDTSRDDTNPLYPSDMAPDPRDKRIEEQEPVTLQSDWAREAALKAAKAQTATLNKDK